MFSPKTDVNTSAPFQFKDGSRNIFTVDFKQLKIPVGAETDSNNSYRDNVVKNSLRESSRTRASVIEDIEKMGKFTEANIQDSIIEENREVGKSVP